MWALQDAKARFSALVDAALAGHPQEVSRRGKPVVVVLSAEEFHRLQADARAAGLRAHLRAMPEGDDVPRAATAPRGVSF